MTKTNRKQIRRGIVLIALAIVVADVWSNLPKAKYTYK